MRHTPLLSRWSIAQWLVALAVVLTHTPVGFAEILRKQGPPPVFTGPGGSAGGSSSGGGGSSSGGGPFVRFDTAEQQKKVFPTVQLGKGEGAIIVEMDRSRKKAELVQLLNMATDLPGMIKEEQTKGLESFENEKKSIESSDRANRHVPALSGSHVQVPGGFEVEPVVGFTDAGSPVPRNGYRDLSINAIASFQATNRSINTMNFSELVLSISQDKEVAAAVGVDVIVGGVVRPFFNFTAKVGDEMVRTVQCATQGMGVSTGCSTPTEFQDYWGSLMTGEGQSYTAGAIALDAIGIGGGSAVAGLSGDAAAAVLKKVPEGLEAVAKGVGRGIERIRTGYAATGFADETGQLLIREGERISGTLASEAASTSKILEYSKNVRPALGDQYVQALPELEGSLKEAFEGQIFKGTYEPGEILFQAQRTGQVSPGNWFGPIRPIDAEHAESLFNILKWGNDSGQIKAFVVKERVSGYAGKVAGGEGHQFYIPRGIKIEDVLEEVK